MRIDILTLFPEMFSGILAHSIPGRAISLGRVDVRTHNFREFARDKHRTVDDYPYGGGAGMVLKPEPLFEAVESVVAEAEAQGLTPDRRRIILLTPQGRTLAQKLVLELAQQEHLVLICGRYEGVDERVRQHLATDEISIGDYVLSGGEIPAMVVVDAVMRLVPGVLGSAESGRDDSFSGGLLQFPQYTRPEVYREWAVPPVLLSGNHEDIARWRRDQAVARTLQRRPDLLAKDETRPCAPDQEGYS